MSNVIKYNFRRQKVFTASDGEVFTTDEKRREYELQLKLMVGLKNFYLNYDICPSVIMPIIKISVPNAQFLSNLFAKIAGLQGDPDGPECNA